MKESFERVKRRCWTLRLKMSFTILSHLPIDKMLFINRSLLVSQGSSALKIILSPPTMSRLLYTVVIIHLAEFYLE